MSVLGRSTRLATGCPTKLEPDRSYDRCIDVAISLTSNCSGAYKGIDMITIKAKKTGRHSPLYLLIT